MAGTVPTNALSALRIVSATRDSSGTTITWQSVTNRIYVLERAADLGGLQPFSVLASDIVGQAGATSYSDTNVVGTGPFFYRVGTGR